MLVCPIGTIEKTLVYLHEAGQRGAESIVLWLGRRESDEILVKEVYRPQQNVRRDRFFIPPAEMQAIMQHLRDHRLMIAAQVHSHPCEAFHSEADDEGAVVRHLGALSFVLPWFAARTDINSFMQDVALFQLREGDVWVEIPQKGKEYTCQILY